MLNRLCARYFNKKNLLKSSLTALLVSGVIAVASQIHLYAATPATLTAPTPTVSGTVRVGSKLTAIPGAWTTGSSFTYQWLKSGVAISGATAVSYTPSSADLGKTLAVRVTGSKSGYTTVAKTSTATAVVAAGVLTAPTPTISGTPKVGVTLTAIPGVWTSGTTLTYQWLKAGVAISGATAVSYTPSSADLGKTLAVRVTGSKSGYTTVAKTSTATAVVAAGVLTAPTPTISGTPKVGVTLTAIPGVWTSGTTLTYQWLKAGVAIANATADKYTIGAADASKALSVRVTGVKAGYATASKTSVASSAVALGDLTSATPTITGTLRVGSVLTANPGTWTSGTAFSYQWLRSGTAINGATALNYTPTASDLGKTLSVKITGSKTGYSSANKTSASTTAIAAALPKVKKVSGSITQNTTWSKSEADVYLIANDLTVESGVTLTIQSGVIVKGTITAYGNIIAAGNVSSPVIFTDNDDDSVGGDSNDDGAQENAIEPQSSVVKVYNGASIKFSNVKVNYTRTLIEYLGYDQSLTKVEVVDSELNASLYLASDAPIIKRNKIHASELYGLAFAAVDPAGVALSGPDTNILIGTAIERGINMKNAEVRPATTWVWSPESNVSSYTGSLHIDGVLDIKPGAIIKSAQITVGENGTLRAIGTSTKPVIFTHKSDDSVGGDFEGDGDESQPSPIDGLTGIPINPYNGATIELSYIKVTYLPGLFGNEWWNDRRNCVIKVSNSDFDVDVYLGNFNRPIVIKNKFRGAFGLFRIGDVTGISTEGTDVNKMLGGSPSKRLVTLSEVSIPENSPWTLSEDMNASSYLMERIYVEGNLVIKPGLIIKKGDIHLGNNSSLKAAGTIEKPIIFTSESDDSAGGDTDAYEGTPAYDDILRPYLITPRNGSSIELSNVKVNYVSNLFKWSQSFGDYYNTSIKITDSVLNTSVQIYENKKPILTRNKIHANNNYGLYISSVEDITGIETSGVDTNIMLGSAQNRTICIYESYIPKDKNFSLTTNSNVSAFAGSVFVDGKLTINPGVVVKGDIDVSGILNVAGSSSKPVLFTSIDDDSVGGDTNNDGSTEIYKNSSPAIRLNYGSSRLDSSIDYAIFNHQQTAVSVSENIELRVKNSKFINTDRAFAVDDAFSFDPALSMYYPLLPCAPPYNSIVRVSDTWFGNNPGRPGMDVDPLLIVPEGLDLLTTPNGVPFIELSTLMTDQMNINVPYQQNTRPWTLYTCDVEVKMGDDVMFKKIGIPVTPVKVDSVPANEPWPAYVQQ